MTAQVALADVLAALTDYGADAAWWREMAQEHPLSVEADGVQVSYDADRWEELAPWAHDSPAEALEALHTAALWPFAVEGAGAVRWWCPLCKGSQKALSALSVGPEGVVLASPDPVPCWCVGEAPSFPDLISVASLGASALLRAASLAEDIARAAGHPKARIVWRVMERAAIEEHHRKAFDEGAAAGVEYVAASTAGLHRADIGELLAWVDETKGDRAVAERVIALALHEDGTATGVHFVGLDAGAVTLAVENVS